MIGWSCAVRYRQINLKGKHVQHTFNLTTAIDFDSSNIFNDSFIICMRQRTYIVLIHFACKTNFTEYVNSYLSRHNSESVLKFKKKTRYCTFTIKSP